MQTINAKEWIELVTEHAELRELIARWRADGSDRMAKECFARMLSDFAKLSALLGVD